MRTFYVDGACSGNPGPGGFGVVEQVNDNFYGVYQSHSDDTTNNREELKAILYVMENFGVLVNNDWCDAPIVYSDSAYAVNTYTNWMFNWERNNWIKSSGGTPENLDIIQTYFDLYQKGYRIELLKIKGHKGIVGNELADDLATGRKTI